MDIEPNIPRTHAYYARQLILVNKIDEAEQELLRAEKIQADEPLIIRLKAWIAAVRGQKDTALALIHKSDSPYAYEISNVYCLLGMNQEAVRAVREGIEKGFRAVKDYLYSNPYLAPTLFSKL